MGEDMILLSDQEFKQITDYIKDNYGINLIEKRNLIEGRLQNVLVSEGFNSFSEYIQYLVCDKTGGAIAILINKITTNHTFFLREINHFNYFNNIILPYLKSSHVRTKDLRLWSAGCSSGEEPYTLAMIIADFFAADKWLWDAKILATDISEKVLDLAKSGIYLNEQLDNVPQIWKTNYFKELDSKHSMVVDKIRNEVTYRHFNLMNEVFPFKSKFHVIFCRNVMIYFDNETKKKLVDKFYEHTEPGGYLFIGHSESLNYDETKYKYIMPAIYRKE